MIRHRRNNKQPPLSDKSESPKRKVRYDWFLRRQNTNILTLRKVWPLFLVLLAVHLLGSFTILYQWHQPEAKTQATYIPTAGRLRSMNLAYYNADMGRALASAGSVSVGGVQDMSQIGYAPRPKAVIYPLDVGDDSALEPPLYPIPDEMEVYPSKRIIDMEFEQWERQEKILNSGHYNSSNHHKYLIYDDYPECQPMYEWQTKSFPTCNNIHEVDLFDLSRERNEMHRQVYFKNHGYFRDVFVVRDADQTKRVLKTLRYRHTFDELNFERHRKDAVAMERLTASPLIMDIYGFCGQASLFDYGEQGNIDSALWESGRRMSYLEKLTIATQVSEAVSSLHTFFDKAPAIAHTDIMTNQFIYVDGRYRLNDFNRCIFLYWNTTSNDGNCPFRFPDENAWLFRSPEEYAYDFQSEKIDVYSMGNVFYVLLEEDWPFHEAEDEPGVDKIQSWVKHGKRPNFVNHPEINNSTNPAVLAIKHAMHMCWEQDWKKRATAKEVEEYLVGALERIGEESEETDETRSFD